MRRDNDEEIIKNVLNSIYTKESNIKLNVNRKLNGEKCIFKFKRLVITCSILLSLFITVPVMATNFSSFERLLDIIDSKFENFLQPIQLISENKGIKMEVVSAMKDEDMIVIYATLQDIEENRIDKTLDLNDSYRIKGLNTYTSEVVDYNEQSKTATIRIQANSKENINNKIIEFSLDSFISNEKNISSSLDNNILAENLKKEVKNEVKLDIDNISGGGGVLYKELIEKKDIYILAKDKLNIEFKEIDCMSITNIGIINNQLHIQTKWDKNKFDNHGLLYLTDKEGNKINTSNANISYSFDENGKTTYGNDYIEYIFDLKNINISNIKLNADIFYSENYMEGPWETRFKIESISEIKSIDNNTYESDEIDKIKISPLGVSILGNNNLEYISSIKINMNNGEQEVLDSRVILDKEDKVLIKFLSNSPINIENINSIDINGNIILIK